MKRKSNHTTGLANMHPFSSRAEVGIWTVLGPAYVMPDTRFATVKCSCLSDWSIKKLSKDHTDSSHTGSF